VGRAPGVLVAIPVRSGRPGTLGICVSHYMPSSAHYTFVDPIPYQAAIRAAEVEAFVTEKGDFRAELTKVDLNRLWMQCARESLPRIFHSAVSPKRAPIVFLVDTDQPAMRHSGLEVSPGEIIVDGLGSTHHHRSWAPSHWGSMSLTPEDLAAAGRAIAGRELTVPAVTCIRRPGPAAMSRLLHLHQTAVRLAKTTPDLLAQAEVARALEQALIHAMITCLTDGTSVEMSPTARHHAAVVARFEELLAASDNRPLYMAEICAATGASERTLQFCCRDHLGMSPIRYLLLRRLHLARRALLGADPATKTVTLIATEHGFYELGRFSVEYRKLFGETPSASLHRPPDDRSSLQAGPFALKK
jgi:AraC-like DNA-binding protein